MSKSLSEALVKMAQIAHSVYSAGPPMKEDSSVCQLCLLDVDKQDHDPDCGWKVAQSLSSNDLSEVRRLARVLAYDGGPQ